MTFIIGLQDNDLHDDKVECGDTYFRICSSRL